MAQGQYKRQAKALYCLGETINPSLSDDYGAGAAANIGTAVLGVFATCAIPWRAGVAGTASPMEHRRRLSCRGWGERRAKYS